MSFRLSSAPEAKMPRVITSRPILANPPAPGKGRTHRRADADALRAQIGNGELPARLGCRSR